MKKNTLTAHEIPKRSVGETLRRYFIMLVGLVINSFGINLITKALLGTSPITSVPYTLSLKFPFTLGEFTFIFNILLILIQLLLLRKKFHPQYWLEIPITFLLSAFIDITAIFFTNFHPANYALQIISLLIGCVVLGMGVSLEFVADVAMLPGEGCVNAICVVFGTDMGKTKVGFDVSMTLISVVMSLIFFGSLISVREGTVVSAILVGIIARTAKPHLMILERFMIKKA